MSDGATAGAGHGVATAPERVLVGELLDGRAAADECLIKRLEAAGAPEEALEPMREHLPRLRLFPPQLSAPARREAIGWVLSIVSEKLARPTGDEQLGPSYEVAARVAAVLRDELAGDARTTGDGRR